MSKCPNKSHPLYKKYEEAIGGDRTYQLYYENDYNLPDYTKHPVYEALIERLSEEDSIRTVANILISGETANAWGSAKKFVPVTNENIDVLGLNEFSPNEYAEISNQLLPDIDQRADVSFLKERFPDAPVDFYEGIQHVGSQVAHGYMKNAAFHIWTNSEVGTGYHEAFHGLTQMYFNEGQRSSLYDAAAEEYNLDRSNELAVEETLAEKFRDYMMLQESAGLPNKIVQFFKSLYYYIKALVTNSTSIDQAYTMLETGRIPQQLKRNMERFNPGGTLYSLRPNYTGPKQRDVLNTVFDIYERQRETNLKLRKAERKTEKELIDQLDNYFFANGFSQKDGSPIAENAKAKVLDLLSAMKQGDAERVAELKAKYNIRIEPSNEALSNLTGDLRTEERRNNIAKHYIDTALNWETAKARKEDIKEDDKNKAVTGNFTTPGWKDIFIDFLPEYGYEYSESDNYIGAQDVQERIFDRSSLEESMRDKLSGRIKAMLATIPEGSEVTVMGTPRRLDPAKVYADILQEVSGAASYQEMMNRLRDASIYKPYLAKVADRIELSDDNNLKSQFTYNFNQHYTDFMRIRIYRDTVSLFSSNRNNLKIKVLDSWRADAFSDPEITGQNIYIIDSKDRLSVNSLQFRKLKKPFENLQKYIRDGRQPDVPDSIIDSLVELLQGISIGQNIPLKEYAKAYIAKGVLIRDTQFAGKDLVQYIFNNLKPAVEAFTDLKFDNTNNLTKFSIKEVPVNFYEHGSNNHILEVLAEMQVKHQTNMVESFLDANKKTIYPFNMPTQLSDVFQKIKENTYLTDFLKDDQYNPTGNKAHQSPLIRMLVDSVNLKQNIDLKKFDAYQIKKGEGETYRDQGELRASTVGITAFLNQGDPDYAYFTLSTQSDRDYSPWIKLPRLRAWKKFGLSDISSTKDIVRNEILSQVAVARNAKEAIDTRGPEDHIASYHFKFNKDGSRNYSTGNALRLTGLLEGLEWKKIDGKEITTIDPKYLVEHEQFDTIVEEYLAEFTNIVTEISKDIESWMLQQQIFANENGQFLNTSGKVVDSFIKSDHPFGKHINIYNSLSQLVQDYTLNTMVINNELQKIFYQSRDFYKNLDDFYKRAGLLTTPGLKPVIKGDISDDWGLKKSIPEIIINDVTNKGDDSVIHTYAKAIKAPWADDYLAGKSNKSDAQGFMSIHGFREWQQAFGEWTPQHEEAYNNYNTIQSDGQYGKFVDNNGNYPVIKPIKPSVIGPMSVNMGEHMLTVPVSIKNSYVVLLREYTNTAEGPLSYIDNLRQRMEAEGEYAGQERIDWANTESTHKMYQRGLVDITTQSDLSNVQVHRIPAELVRVPQVKPEKKSDTILLASQPLRLLTTLLNPVTQPYKLQDAELSREEMLDTYHKVINQKIENSINEIRETLAYSNEQKFDKVQMLKNLREYLKEQNRNSNRPLSDNQIKAMDIPEYGDQADYSIPLAFPAFARKNEQMLFSLFRNNLIQQKVHGKQAVQVADMGGINNAHNDLAFVTPQGDRVAEGVIGNIAKAEVAVSADFADMLGIQEGDNLADISEEFKTLLGFRIPTSGKNLMIPMVVKRILPRNYSATIIVPGRITTQMGSDFDIDTLFLYAPRNVRRKDKLHRKKYNRKNIAKNDNEQLDNLHFDLMESILTHPDHFAEMIQPLEGGILGVLAKEYKPQIDAAKSARFKNPNSPFANIDYQIRNRDGGIGIGIYSNALMGISTAQHMGVQISEKKAVTIAIDNYENVRKLSSLMPANENGLFVDIEGNFIEHNITEHQVASIDNPKDPIMHYLNDNLVTMPATLFMLSSGLDLRRTTQFRNQPIIRKFVEEYENKQAKPYQIKEIAKSLADIDAVEGEIILDYVNNFEKNSDAELLKAFTEYHSSGTDFMKLSNIITPNRISDMSSNAALAEYFDDIDYINSAKFDTYIIPSHQQTKVNYLDSLYPMNQGYRKAIKEAVDFTQNFFPYNNDAVRFLKHDLYKLIGKDKLTKEIHKQYHDFMFANMISMDTEGNPNFEVDYVRELLLDRKNQPSLVSRVLKLKETDPVFAQNPFITALSKNRYNATERIKMFEFNSPVHYDKNESNIFTEAFKALYFTDKYQDVMTDLAYYGIFTTGFAPNPNSFVSIIPVEVWQDVGIDSYFRQNLQALKDDQDIALFTELNYDFIYNNVDTPGLLHSIQLEKGDHKKDVLTLPHEQADSIGALFDNKVRKFVRVYNPDSRAFDLWVFTNKDKEGDTTYYTFRKSGKKGTPYRLTEVNLGDESVLAVNNNHPLMTPPQNDLTYRQSKSRMYDFKSKKLTLKKTFEDIGLSIHIEHVPNLPEFGTIRTTKKALEDLNKGKESIESIPVEERTPAQNEDLQNIKEEIKQVQSVKDQVYIELRDMDNVETQVHEFGHLYTELLGYESKIIQEGINQLRDGELWKEVHKLYDDYTIKEKELETLVTAIGQEGAKYLQLPWWKAWWSRMLNKVKEILGIERNVAQQLAQEMLNNDLRPVNTSEFIFDRTLRHKDAMKFENSKRLVQDVILSLDKQIENLRELSTDPKKSVQLRANLRSRLEKVLKEKKGIKEEIQGVQLFIEQAHSELKRVNKEMEEMKYQTPTDLMKKAGEMLQIMEDYQILDMIKQDAGPQLKKIGDGVTMDLLQHTIDFRDNAKQGLNDIVIPKMAQELVNKAHPEIEKGINEMLEKIDEGNIPLTLNAQIKKTNRYRQIQDENITAEEKKHKIQELAKDHLKSRIPNSQNVETYLREAVNGNRYFLWMVDPVIYSDDQAINLFTLFVKDKLADARRDTLQWRDRLDNLHKKFIQKTDRQGWNNELAYEFMVEDVDYNTVSEGEFKTIKRKSIVQPYNMQAFIARKNSVIKKLNAQFIPKDVDFKEWAESNPEKYKEYKTEMYKQFYKDNMSPIEGWEAILDKKWNSLNQNRNELEQLNQKEQLTPKEEAQADGLRASIEEVEYWLEDNFADYPSIGKPTRPIRELSRPSTGEGLTNDYSNPRYNQIQNDPVIKEFYDEFLSIFQELQDIYGSYNFDTNAWDQYSYYLPSVRKSQKDRLLENGIKDSAEEFFRTFTTLNTDDVYGQYVDNRKKVPIYYANAVDSRDVSNDVPSSLMLFAKQAEEYKQLTEMLGHVHVMRNILENRHIPKQDAKGNNLYDRLSNMRGWVRNVTDSVPANQTKQYNQWSDWIDTIFYGIAEEKAYLPGTNIELNKLMNKINSYAAFNVFPFNFLQGVANVLIGNSYIIQEAIAGEHFTKADYAKAQQLYTQAAPGLLNDIGRTQPVSKLGQLMDLFDAQEGMTTREIARNVFNTRGKNLTTIDQAFFLQRSGELQMAVTPFLAIMHNTKVSNAEGETISLYEAYEIQSNGRIGLKKGYTLSKEQQNEITNKSNALNRSMQGIYDRFNAPHLKKRWYGKPLLLFRSWLLPTFRRFWGYNQGDFRYDHEMGSIRDGIYKTGFRFLSELGFGEKKLTMDLYRGLSNPEKRNVKKFLAHMGMIAITTGLISALRPEEGEEVGTDRYYALYWTHRLRSELMIFLLPHTEGLKLLRSPAASMMVAEKITKFAYYLGAAPFELMIDGDVERYQRRVGQFEKGTPKLYKRFRDLIPGLNAWDNSRSPEEAYKWYTKLF